MILDWTWTKPEVECGTRNRYSNCDEMNQGTGQQNSCLTRPDMMIEMCPETSCPRTKCSGGSGVDYSTQCKDLCPGSGCTSYVQDLCTDKGCWSWSKFGYENCYGGCNGKFKSYFDENCKKTCNLC